MKIPPSKEELKAVRDSVRQLEIAMCQAAILSANLIEILEDNFLAIDKNYKKQILIHEEKIMSNLWKLNIVLCKMNDFKERIISSEEN